MKKITDSQYDRIKEALGRSIDTTRMSQVWNDDYSFDSVSYGEPFADREVIHIGGYDQDDNEITVTVRLVRIETEDDVYDLEHDRS